MSAKKGHPVAGDVIAMVFSYVVAIGFWVLAHGSHGWEKWAAYVIWFFWGVTGGHFLLRLWRRFRDGVPS